MNKITVYYKNKKVLAFLLARFNMLDDEIRHVKGLFGRNKQITFRVNRQYCLVFIPWKRQEKELAFIPIEQVITLDALVGDDVVEVEKYVSPFTEEAPYYAQLEISNFVGYNFIYDYKNFIADIKNQCPTKPLNILYERHPELLQEEFDEEKCGTRL